MLRTESRSQWILNCGAPTSLLTQRQTHYATRHRYHRKLRRPFRIPPCSAPAAALPDPDFLEMRRPQRPTPNSKASPKAVKATSPLHQSRAETPFLERENTDLSGASTLNTAVECVPAALWRRDTGKPLEDEWIHRVAPQEHRTGEHVIDAMRCDEFHREID